MIWRAKVEIYYPRYGEPHYRGTGQDMMMMVPEPSEDSDFINLHDGSEAKWFYVEVDDSEL